MRGILLIIPDTVNRNAIIWICISPRTTDAAETVEFTGANPPDGEAPQIDRGRRQSYNYESDIFKGGELDSTGVKRL